MLCFEVDWNGRKKISRKRFPPAENLCGSMTLYRRFRLMEPALECGVSAGISDNETLDCINALPSRGPQ